MINVDQPQPMAAFFMKAAQEAQNQTIDRCKSIPAKDGKRIHLWELSSKNRVVVAITSGTKFLGVKRVKGSFDELVVSYTKLSLENQVH